MQGGGWAAGCATGDASATGSTGQTATRASKTRGTCGPGCAIPPSGWAAAARANARGQVLAPNQHTAASRRRGLPEPTGGGCADAAIPGVYIRIPSQAPASHGHAQRHAPAGPTRQFRWLRQARRKASGPSCPGCRPPRRAWHGKARQPVQTAASIRTTIAPVRAPSGAQVQPIPSRPAEPAARRRRWLGRNRPAAPPRRKQN